MDNDLYFIPILAEALDRKETKQSLKQALEKITSLGAASPYRQGYEQFRQFMDIVKTSAAKSHAHDIEPDSITELITALACDTFAGSEQDRHKALAIIASCRPWKEAYDRLVEEVEPLKQTPKDIRICLSRDREPVSSVAFTHIPDTRTIANIRPGSYRIALESGRVLWEGELTGKDLIWTEAYPQEPFKLAADTAARKAPATKQVNLWNGQITIRVFAGLESGRLEIAMNQPKEAK